MNIQLDRHAMHVKNIVAAALVMALRVAHADVDIDAKVRDNFGITTAAAATVQMSRQWQASAQVLDAAALVSSLAELRSAQAAQSASRAELRRLEALYQADNNAALKTVEAARTQAISDNSRVQSVQAQLLNTWGSALNRMSSAQREQLVQELLTGKLVLIRAELADAPATLSAQSVRLRFFGDEHTVNARLLSGLPQITAQSLGRSYLLSVQVTNELELQPGQVLSAELQDAGRIASGIKLPRSAVLRWQGQRWAYVERANFHYERVLLSITQWLDDAALVAGDIKPGDNVVVTGAGLLLGAELKPAEATEE